MSTEKKFIKLRSSDGEVFQVEEAVAFQSETIKDSTNYESVDDDGIFLSLVTGKILRKVIDYCLIHSTAVDDSVQAWDDEFVEEIQDDHPTVFALILASNYLNIKNLNDLTCEIVAKKMKGKTPQQIREIFNIKNGSNDEINEQYVI